MAVVSAPKGRLDTEAKSAGENMTTVGERNQLLAHWVTTDTKLLNTLTKHHR